MPLAFLGPDTDAYVASVGRHVGEFTERTGIEVDVRIVDSDTYFSNDIHALLDGEDGADVFMSGPVLLWEHVGAGFVEPLDDFAAAGWDAGDFFASLLDANRWTGRFGEPLGAGPLLEVPVNCESYNLAYVPEHLERHGLEVPATWDAYFETAARAGAAVGRACADSASAACRCGTRCTRATRRRCGRPAGATSTTTGAARSPRPRSWRRPSASSTACARQGRRTGSSSAGTSSRSTSPAAPTG